MTSRRWVMVLVVAALADALFEALQLTASGWGESVFAGPWMPVVALGWDAVVVLSAVGVTTSFRTAWRQLYRQHQIETAAGALSSDWLWESDRDGRITYSSPGVAELLGYAPGEVVGRHHDELLLGDPDARSDIRRHITARDGWEWQEAQWRHKDGTPVRLIGSAIPIHDRRGDLVGYRGTRRVASTAQPSEVDAAAERLTRVIENDEVDVALQPIISLATGQLEGVEALARFRDRRSPDTWFREAARISRVRDLDEHMFMKALGVLDTLPPHIYLSVNAGPELIMDAGFRRRLLASGAPLHRLVIEVTEHARVSDYDTLRVAVSSLREHHVRFAIDDTGAGYASFNHVLQLRPDVIKLDRGLLCQLNDDPARRSLVTALVLLAMDIGATLTGEGVENGTQLDTLATLGVDHAQGYHLARPTTERRRWRTWWNQQWLPNHPSSGRAIATP